MDRWVNLLLLAALTLGGCVTPATAKPISVAAAATIPPGPPPTLVTVTAKATATATTTPTPTATGTPDPTPTPRKIVVPSGGSSSSVRVRIVTSTPTPTVSPTPAVDATAQAIAAGAAPLIFTGLSIDQKCGRGDVVAVDGHELLATPRLLAGNSNFLELLPEGAQVDILDCMLWNDAEELSWLAVRTAKGKLGWMILQPDKFYVTLFPVALAPSRSLTGVAAGTTLAYAPPTQCQDGPVSNEAVATSIGIDLIPVVGDVKGLGEAATGCDLVTGESLGDWRWFGLLGLIGMSELALARHGDDAVRAGRIANGLDGGLRYGDDVAQAIGKNADLARSASKLDEAAGAVADAAKANDARAAELAEVAQALAKVQPCSFAADTLVTTRNGPKPIGLVRVGEMVLAYDEDTGETGYFPVLHRWVHIDALLTIVTIGAEKIVTTPDHPFYVDGQWVPAGALTGEEAVASADGAAGKVTRIRTLRQRRVMYNLTVAAAHTFFVGEGQWLVHNECPFEIASKIAQGHAYTKHLGDFPGVRTQEEFEAVILDVLRNAEDQKELRNGRHAYWKNGILVITDPSSADYGTAFRPGKGKVYFDELE